MLNDTELLFLANQALGKIVKNQISSLTEKSVTAIAVKAVIYNIVPLMLQQHRWSFAIEIKDLNSLGKSHIEGLTKFQIPKNCLSTINLISNSRFVTEGRAIHTEDKTPTLRYIKNIDTLTGTSPLFREACILRAAAELVLPLTRNTVLFNGMSSKARDMLIKAIGFDEGIQQQDPVYSWLYER